MERPYVSPRGGTTLKDHRYYVYMVQSISRRALYIGMTSNISRRIFQHKTHRFDGFTDDCNATRLVYFECYSEVSAAITREKQLKRWRREKKEWLIAQKNPQWKDLADEWFPHLRDETKGPSTPPR